MFDPATGAKVSGSPTNTQLLDPANTTVVSPFVGNQTFADSVLFESAASGFFSDNIVDRGLQADLNGRIWSTKAGDLTTAKVLIDVSAKAGQSQPIYYSPAVSGFEPGTGSTGTNGCNVYAFASGTFYETSDAVTGSNIGTGSAFTPNLYIAADKKSNTILMQAVPGANILQLPIGGIVYAQGTLDEYTLSPQSQVTAPPFLLVDAKGIATSTAVFVVYDKLKGCNGNTYVVVIDSPVDRTCVPAAFGSGTGGGGGGGGGTGGGGGGGTGGGGGGGGGGSTVPTSTYKVFDAGAGAASGAVVAGDKILVVKSGVGDEKAGVYEPPNIKAAIGAPTTPTPLWWKELK